jgi:hypothetical protein
MVGKSLTKKTHESNHLDSVKAPSKSLTMATNNPGLTITTQKTNPQESTQMKAKR